MFQPFNLTLSTRINGAPIRWRPLSGRQVLRRRSRHLWQLLPRVPRRLRGFGGRGRRRRRRRRGLFVEGELAPRSLAVPRARLRLCSRRRRRLVPASGLLVGENIGKGRRTLGRRGLGSPTAPPLRMLFGIAHREQLFLVLLRSQLQLVPLALFLRLLGESLRGRGRVPEGRFWTMIYLAGIRAEERRQEVARAVVRIALDFSARVLTLFGLVLLGKVKIVEGEATSAVGVVNATVCGLCSTHSDYNANFMVHADKAERLSEP